MRWDIKSQCLRTNNGNKIYSCNHIVAEINALGLAHLPLDGEAYWHGPEYSFSYLNGKVRRKQSSAETAFLQYHIFDLARYGESISKFARLSQLLDLFSDPIVKGSKTLFLVPYNTTSGDSESVDLSFEKALNGGYEGIMICDPCSSYMEGKGKWMWKHKPVYDAEFAFDGFEYAAEGRNVGTFAAIRLKMVDGRTFTCSGINDDMKQQLLSSPPPKWQPITVEYGDLSDTGVPIFPRFKAVRYDQ